LTHSPWLKPLGFGGIRNANSLRVGESVKEHHAAFVTESPVWLFRHRILLSLMAPLKFG
jgi:hypothetical protein